MGRNGRRKKDRGTKERKNPIQVIFGWIFQIFVVALFAFVLVFLFGQSRTNVGQSMDATLSGGDVVLLNKLAYGFGGPRRNDVIAFRPDGSENSRTYIRRVIGLPGETIQIKDGMIYINDAVYLEDVDRQEMETEGIASDPITLDTDEYFVLGDNRNDSEDSRFADIGNVKLDDIEGKVWFVISPKEHLGFVK